MMNNATTAKTTELFLPLIAYHKRSLQIMDNLLPVTNSKNLCRRMGFFISHLLHTIHLRMDLQSKQSNLSNLEFSEPPDSIQDRLSRYIFKYRITHSSIVLHLTSSPSRTSNGSTSPQTQTESSVTATETEAWSQHQSSTFLSNWGTRFCREFLRSTAKVASWENPGLISYEVKLTGRNSHA